MSSTDRIELRRVRDFGATINVIFEFLRQNWRPIGKSLVYIMAPVLILATIVAGAYFRMVMNVALADEWSAGMLDTYTAMIPTIGLMTLAFSVSMVFMFGVVVGYVRLYNSRYPEPIEVDDVWREVRGSFWRITGTIVVSTLSMVVPMIVLFIPAALTELWWLIPIAFFIAAVPAIYLWTCMAIVVPMRLEEEIGTFAAIGRSMRLMKGRWWFTFWLFVVIQIILSFASMFFQLPLQAIIMMQGIGGLTSPGIVFYLAAGLNVIGTYLLYSILILTCTIQYYNLVEQKEGVAMADRINEIGVMPDEPTTSL